MELVTWGILRNAAEIACMFVLNRMHFVAFLCANVYISNCYHGNINIKNETVQMLHYCWC